MVKPERRTRGDVLGAAAIAVVVALAAALIWWTSDARATVSRTAGVAVPTPPAARDVPVTLRQLWTAASPATAAPVVVGGTVATGDGRRVDGRDAGTGESRWSYTRDTDLCGLSWVYHSVVAVYRDDRGCGQVSGLNSATGSRGPARSGYADPRVRLSSDSMTVLSIGDTRLELWRSDLVRVLTYGETDARVKPVNRGLHSGCTLVSAAASSSAVSVLENCANQAGLRLVLLRPGKDDDEPQQKIVPEPGIEAGARVLAVWENNTAVYLPGGSGAQPRVEVVDETGATVSSTPLSEPPSNAAAVSQAGSLITWWTGDSLMVFDAGRFALRYTIAAGAKTPLGPAVMMAGRLLVPVTGGIGVYDPLSGANERYIAVDRAPSTAAVVPAVAGSWVVEQRGDTVVALG
jgi:hypothetical protein